MIAVDFVTPTPTPESPTFPVDPVLLLQDQWPSLVFYYVFTIPIVFFVWRRLQASRFAHAFKPRLITAAVLAVIFTPGEVSDFFLFTTVGPAAAGLLFLLIGLAFALISNPGALFKASLWLGLGKLLGGYYLLPLLVVFGIAYTGLWMYSRSHQRSAQAPNERPQL